MFGKSMFKGQHGFNADMFRWRVQCFTLVKKNCLILARRRLQLLVLLLIPLGIVPIFLLANSHFHVKSHQILNTNPLLKPQPLDSIGECNTYFSKCIPVVYSPATQTTDLIMRNVASLVNSNYYENFRGFQEVDEAKNFVANNVGKVQFTVFFTNQSLWTRFSSLGNSVNNSVSYVIFVNGSTTAEENSYGVNFPLLSLQKSIESSILQSIQPDNTDFVYDLSYGQIWSYQPPVNLTALISGQTNATSCPTSDHNFHDVAMAAPWVFSFGLHIIGVVCFQMLTEERGKHLFSALRRLGLMDSAYWISWFLAFQIILIAGCTLAVILAAIIRPVSFALQRLDLGVLFLVLWLGGTATVCDSLFLASVCNGPSMATSFIVFNFVIIIFTIVFSSTPINAVTAYSTLDSGGMSVVECLRVTSSYNAIYSHKLTGNTFVQFLVFFMPWFHISQAITNILSVIQYGDSVTMSNLSGGNNFQLSYDGTMNTLFHAKWISWSLGMMVASSVLFVFLAWLCGQLLPHESTEGRPVVSVLVPASLRKYWFGQSGVVIAGDVRREEQVQSAADGSIRAYKVSKTFAGVQALKEVTVQMTKGQVFVLLGQNGAGKSTLINILTGLCAPTHGSVFMSGLSVDNDMASIQQIIGVCAQDNLLWDDLTAREHLLIYAAFKGLQDGEPLHAGVNAVLKKVHLADKGDVLARNFSGGMQRRLSVAMSAVGEVEVLFLDEPTTGLDPLSRRQIWDMIHWMKTDRVVVLTTHNLEEADYLGDSVMIMHGGRVKAWGDPLFLKQTYGTGYQLNLVVDKIYSKSLMEIVLQFLPGSSFIGDCGTGFVALNVSKRDVPNISNFFSWLERSPDAIRLVKEWTISNTTLEQVFLLLCSQSTDVNFVDSRSEVDAQLCPLCRIRNREATVLRLLHQPKKLVMLPDGLCEECSVQNSHFFLSEEDYLPLLLGHESRQHELPSEHLPSTAVTTSTSFNPLLANGMSKQMFLINMLRAAQAKAAASASNSSVLTSASSSTPAPPPQSLVKSDPALPVCLPSDSASSGNQTVQQQPPPVQASATNNSVTSVSPGPLATRKSEGAIGSWQSQINAIVMKNVTLQHHQRCSNCCVLIFIIVMFVLLYIFALIFSFTETFVACDQGYIIFGGECSDGILADHLFSASSFPFPASGDTVGPLGYTILDYLVPSSPYGTYTLEQETPASNSYEYYVTTPQSGLPSYSHRFPAVWSPFLDNIPFASGTADLVLNMYPFPDQSVRDDPNGFLYSLQQQIFDWVLYNGYPDCTAYAPEILLNLSSPDVASIQLSDYRKIEIFSSFNFADAVFDCNTCQTNQTNYFNGTLWVSNVGYGRSFYPYLYVDVTLPDSPSLGESCPSGITTVTEGPLSNTNFQTVEAMQYLNLLTNTIYDSSLENYIIQGGVSTYGTLVFGLNNISELVSFFLTIFATLLMNGLWPLTVWRLSYERCNDIQVMMKSVGMRSSAYVIGMYVFDTFLTSLVGISTMILMCKLRMSRFDAAPLGYLCTICLMSAHALNGFAMMIVRLAPKSARLTTCFCAVLSVASSMAAVLTIVIKYPSEGSWPNALSLYPFFAQSRAIYLILVYHQTSPEVDTAIGLMFLMGTIFLAFAFIADLGLPANQLLKNLELLVSSPPRNIIPVTNSRGYDTVQPRDTSTGLREDGDLELTTKIPDDNSLDLDTARRHRSGGDEALLPLHAYCPTDNDVIAERDVACRLETSFAVGLSGASSPPDIESSDCITPLNSTDYALVLHKLHHEFSGHNEHVVAVNELSLALRYGEVFGLLGPNGAGTIQATSGTVLIAGQDLKHSQSNIHKLVGMCPQFDVIWNDMTVEEHLFFQARQRGVLGSHLYAEVQRVAVQVGLDGDPYRTPAGKLSGGMRRRLSIGMSIVADPPIIFLDECTAGLDPENRQHIWNVIQRLQKPNRLILLSTHSMEEAETLCSRVGILSRGLLQCIGTTVHLKTKFGSGYTLTINLPSLLGVVVSVPSPCASAVTGMSAQSQQQQQDVNCDCAAVLDCFIRDDIGQGAGELVSSVNNTRRYKVPKSATSISELFSKMEANRFRLCIREWGLSMTTLEEVFISTVKTEQLM